MNYPSLSLGQKQIENAFTPQNYQRPSLKQQRGHFQGTNNLPLKSNFHLNEITKCEQCEYKTSKYDLIYSHVRVKHSDLKIKCTECNFSHPFPTKVNTHYKHVHLGVKRHHRRYICRNEFCHSFGKQDCAELETHSLLYCKVCKYSSARSDDFKFHMQSVHEGIVYPCVYCSSYVAKRKLNLDRHIMAQHPQKSNSKAPGTCSCTEEGCHFETQYRNTLKKHIESKHEGMVRFKCSFMNCDYRTNESKSLKEHSFVHNGDSPHRCDTCDKMFTRLRQMKKHKKKQHVGTDDEKLAKPQNAQFQKIESTIALMKPEINFIKDENKIEFDTNEHHIHGNKTEKEAKNLEEEQKYSAPQEKTGKTCYSCLCAAPGCDFMSDEVLQKQEMREHFDSAHEELTFANDSFILLNSDMTVVLGMDV